MADAFRETDTILFRQSVTFQTGFGVMADESFTVGSPTTTNSSIISYNPIIPWGGVSGYFPTNVVSGLNVFYNGYTNSNPSVHPALFVITGQLTHGSGIVSVTVGDIENTVLYLQSDNRNINSTFNQTFLQTNSFQIICGNFPDGLFNLNALNGTVSIGDISNDANGTSILVDDDNNLITINSPTLLSIGLVDNSNNVSIDSTNRRLYNTGANITLDWQNRILSGNWTGQALVISGSSVITSAQTGIFVTTSQTGNFISQSIWSNLTWGATTNWTAQPNVYEDRKILILTGNTTLAITGIYGGWNANLMCIQSGVSTSGYSLTLPSSTKVMNAGSGQIVLTPASGAIDFISFISTNGHDLYANIGNNFN